MERSRFRDLRLFFGLDQASMARWFDTTQSVISLWEKNKRTPPLYQAAVRFGVSMDWLAGLSHRMWGERVADLGRRYRLHLCELPEENKRRLSDLSPVARVLYTFEFLQGADPELVSRDYFALLLGLTPEAFHLLVDNQAGLSQPTLERLADYTGVPSQWFGSGDFSLLEEPDLDEYYPLVHQMRTDGISPEDIRRIWNLIKTIR